MKIVLSRKGFDAQYGRCPSPILPDGRPLSLPIPVREHSAMRFCDVRDGAVDVGFLVEQLSHGRLKAEDCCHLDPDLVRCARPRSPGWRPAFGQTSRAQSHLARCGVHTGDLFLFFGWFRPVEKHSSGVWRYRWGSLGMHHLFGWLQIGEIIHLGGTPNRIAGQYPAWADHPHLSGNWDDRNTLYIAKPVLKISGLDVVLPGDGAFTSSHSDLILTKMGQERRSVWRLPSFFHPEPGRPPLTYHGDPRRWQRDGEHVLLNAVAKGQEFVFDIQGVDGAIDWLATLFEKEARKSPKSSDMS